MLDLHCHILPGVDDGAPDLGAALEMARCLLNAGYTDIAPSPHYGEGPGGNVSPAEATAKRSMLQEALAKEKLSLTLHPNAEHHITPHLFELIGQKRVVPIGENGTWLLVELPWRSIPKLEDIFFRLALKGYPLILAHPERYSYLDLGTVERLVSRGVKMQIEIGSFAGIYGKRALTKAMDILDRGCAHILATDMHKPDDANAWMRLGMNAIIDRYGKEALHRGTHKNPFAILNKASPDTVEACTEGR